MTPLVEKKKKKKSPFGPQIQVKKKLNGNYELSRNDSHINPIFFFKMCYLKQPT